MRIQYKTLQYAWQRSRTVNGDINARHTEGAVHDQAPGTQAELVNIMRFAYILYKSLVFRQGLCVTHQIRGIQ